MISSPWSLARAALRLLLCLSMVASLAPQRGGGWLGLQSARYENVSYNGRFTFSRVRYDGPFGRGSSWWNHDYPQADINLPLILDSITAIQPNLRVSNIFDLEDPEIFRNPVLYMWEPGFWDMTDAAAANLRTFMLKGGLIVFDDFEAELWTNFEAQFRRALPEAEFVKLDTTHPLFHSFFEMNTLDLPHPSDFAVTPAFFGVFEDNNPRGRMLALVFYNSDVAEYWEWSGRGRYAVDTTNDAYKLGVNYMVYALTH